VFSNDGSFTEGPWAKFVSSAISDRLSTVHYYNHWLIAGLTALHVCAITFYLLARKEDLLTPMLTGDKLGIDAPAADDGVALRVRAAVLAVLGYSVNESVIIFDRVREHFKKMRRATVVEVIDSAITATISRTIITHGCTLAMSLSMLFFGGPALHYFALALTIGILFGIYSSVFVAAAIAMYLGIKREDLVKPVKREDEQQLMP